MEGATKYTSMKNKHYILQIRYDSNFYFEFSYISKIIYSVLYDSHSVANYISICTISCTGSCNIYVLTNKEN
jgi:hypothetical protein